MNINNSGRMSGYGLMQPMKNSFITITLLLGYQLAFSQGNCFKKFPIVYAEYNPFYEYFLFDRFYFAPKDVKSIKLYSPRLRTSIDTVNSLITNGDNFDSTLLYNYEFYRYDTSGRLIEYKAFSESGKLSNSFLKTYKENEIIIEWYSDTNLTTEIYKLNKFNLPIAMYKNGALELQYEYNDSNYASRIIYRGELVYDFTYQVVDNTIIVDSRQNGVKNRILKYNDKFHLLGITTYNDSVFVSHESVYSYNSEGFLNKTIHLDYYDKSNPYESDITYLYNSDGKLAKEISFDDISNDLSVIEYQYNRQGELNILYSYYLNSKEKSQSMILYRYEHY